MNLLVTGGAGFIGSNFIHYWLENYPEDRVVNYDLLTYAGNLDNLKEIKDNPNYAFVKGDIGDYELAKKTLRGIDTVVNFAAESHNDRGVIDPSIFVKTNVLGTEALLRASLDSGVKRFHHISTCEVFGDLGLDENKAFKETDRYNPRTPYNASKAAANHMVMSYYHTFKLPITLSHCGNNYGPYQFPEKLIPLFTTNAIENKELPLFKSSHNKREWIHVKDHARAIDKILQNGKIGEAYNIGTGIEKSVEEITDVILQELNKPQSLKKYVEDRKGHDRRYLLDSRKIKNELGWGAQVNFITGLKETIHWYLNNSEWWENIKNRSYREYYDNYYKSLE